MTLFNIQLPNWPWVAKRPKCLLLVEDNASDAFLIQAALKHLKWGCDIANSAEMAEGLLFSTLYQVALVDMRLPGKPGWTLLSEIIQMHPKVFTVAMAGEPSDLAHLPHGVFGSFIIKPDPGQTYEPALRRMFEQARL